MDCAKIEELTSEYVEGTLPAGLDRAVRAHLDACPACAADVAGVRSLCARLATLPAAEPPPFFHENVMAAVAREADSRRTLWPAFLPRLGRVALGTLAAGALAAALAWTRFQPAASRGIRADMVMPMPGIGENPPPISPAPRLRLSRTTVIDPEHGPGYEYAVRLEGVGRGTARFHLLRDDALAANTQPVARFTFADPSAMERLRVPFKSVRGGTLNLYVQWTAGDQTHRTYLFEPIPRSDDLLPERQSFGLPESSLPVAARAVAQRYGRSITLEDVPDVDGVTVIAGDDRAEQALDRALAGRGLRVLGAKSGIRIIPASPAAR